MVDITSYKKRDIITVRQGEDSFTLTDGFITYPRAMLHITPECPTYIRDHINVALAQGWVKCIAHVQGKELTWQHLSA